MTPISREKSQNVYKEEGFSLEPVLEITDTDSPVHNSVERAKHKTLHVKSTPTK